MSGDPTVAGLVPASWLWMLLGAVIYPLWLAAGVGDVLVHWRDRIERHTGTHESWMHVAMCVQMGIPVLLVLFFDVTAPVFLIATAAVTVHGWTSWRDARFADRVRHIGPLEQKIHVALDAVPWLALALLALLHAPALHGLVDGAEADWSWRMRAPAFPTAVIATIVVTAIIFGLMPSVLELRRARRAVRAL
ncbi:diguanylate cyclase [Lysobacter sp. TY2-98]|uniref:diguanylate cyclase n=1 Tax=Lysobacter sp. TY2-98 TaxID=2290922 RepID=UPI000E201452|nr:diguanylate cyclase [Lysobacter sp. TY2-98]AXK73110.1 diguanylate cyclase [Lysobacter sp. TY2-98]